MKRFLKWGAIIFGCLVVVVIAALILIPMFVDVAKYKPLIEKKVTEATGRPFTVGDDLSLSLFPWAGISFSQLHLGNPAGFSEKDFVQVKSFEARVKLLPLISKDIQIKRFVLNKPQIFLIKNKNGKVNWEQPQQAEKAPTAKKEPTAKTPPSGMQIPISALTAENISIDDGSVIYIDHTTDTRREITDVNLALKDVSLRDPVKLTFSARLDQKPLSVEGTVGPLNRGLQEGKIALDLSLKALDQLAMQLKGFVLNPTTNPGVDLNIELAEFSPRKLMSELGMEFPVATTDPEAISRLSFKSHVKADAAKLSLTDGIMELDQSRMMVSASAAEFSKPDLKFDVSVDQINLDRYLPPESGPAKKSPQPQESKKIDYGPLRRLILDGTLKIAQLTVKKAQIQDALVQITAKNGVLNLDPVKLKLYQGDALAKAVVNVAQDTPKSNFSLNLNGVQVEPLLKDTMEKDFLMGTASADINLKMAGDDPEMIKKTLDGQGELKFKDGAIVGFDLSAMARNIGSAFGLAKKVEERPRTDFSELLAPFTIKNGVVNTPQTTLKSPFVRLTVVGNADLVKETLDLRVDPKAVATIKGQGDQAQRSGIMVPVTVSGTFSDPVFRPDLSSTAKKQIEEKILESKEAKKLLQKEELKPLENKAKGVLKGILGN